MLPYHSKPALSLVIFVVIASAFASIRICGQTTPVQGSVGPTGEVPVYFPASPPDWPTKSVFSHFLSYMGEPSLLDKANDNNALVFRVSFFRSQHGTVVAVRLVVDTDGTARITSAVSSTPVQRTKDNVSAAGIEKFQQLVEKAGFWSMRVTEPVSPLDNGRKVYVLDGMPWLMEGVRNGKYHFVFRENPVVPSSFTEIGRYLTKDLAKLDDSVISIPKYSSP